MCNSDLIRLNANTCLSLPSVAPPLAITRLIYHPRSLAIALSTERRHPPPPSTNTPRKLGHQSLPLDVLPPILRPAPNVPDHPFRLAHLEPYGSRHAPLNEPGWDPALDVCGCVREYGVGSGGVRSGAVVDCSDGVADVGRAGG